jgi:hypothetical protein
MTSNVSDQGYSTKCTENSISTVLIYILVTNCDKIKQRIYNIYANLIKHCSKFEVMLPSVIVSVVSRDYEVITLVTDLYIFQCSLI